MYHYINEFAEAYEQERQSTLKILGVLTDQSLAQAVAPGHRTLCRLAWHIVLCNPGMAIEAGLTTPCPAYEIPAPAHAAEITHAYDTHTLQALESIRQQWTDAMLEEETVMYGEQWKRGFSLEAMLRHEIHHRGQLTVLMRQASLAVPGVYGPSQEEWAQLGMPPQE